MFRSIGKQSGESVESVTKKKRKATVERICRKGRFKPGPTRFRQRPVSARVSDKSADCLVRSE